MHNKLISVNITTYNRAHLLSRCLDSVISQTYPNVEIILVDDCSDDNTTEVVKEYQKDRNNIHYIKHNVNKGLAFARNTALKNSSGFYIAFMDDDDVWIDNHKLKKQVEIFKNSPDTNLAIVCSSVQLIDEKKNFRQKIIIRPENLCDQILKGNGIIYSPTVLTLRSIANKIGGFDTRIPRGIDSDFYRTCIVKYGFDVFFMKEITTAIHEYGDDRITPQDNLASIEKSISSIEIFFTKFNKYLSEKYDIKRIRYKQLFVLALKLFKKKYSFSNIRKSIKYGMFFIIYELRCKIKGCI
jgi:glycosyltransferase involved in cell wall biosynthesis